MKFKYNSGTILRSKVDKGVNLMVKDIENAVKTRQLIMLIKYWRSFTGSGLKDSKDAIESFLHKDSSGAWIMDDSTVKNVVEGFYNRSFSPELTKEEFMNIISEAIDNKDKFHCEDMLDAVEFLFKGIRQKGGLVKIAEEHETFLNGI